MVLIFKMFKIDPKIDPKKLALKIVREIVTAYLKILFNTRFCCLFSAGISPISAQRFYICTYHSNVFYILYTVCSVQCVFFVLCVVVV